MKKLKQILAITMAVLLAAAYMPILQGAGGTSHAADDTHKHSFTYSADSTEKNKITATCTCTVDDCALKGESIPVTLEVTDAEYTGKPYSGATIGGEDAWKKAGAAELSITYEPAGEESESAPTDVGEYKATLHVAGNDSVTVTCDFEITKKKIALPSPEFTYNGKSQSVTSKNTDEYEFIKKDSEDSLSKTNFGEYKATADLIDENNYQWDLNVENPSNPQQIEWKINKKLLTVTATSLTSAVGKKTKELTYTFDGLCDSDSIDGGLTTDPKLDENTAREYRIIEDENDRFAVEDGNGGNNYIIIFHEGVYTITNLKAYEIKFDDTSVEKPLTDETYTQSAKSTDGRDPDITYSGDNAAVATVDSTTGEVTFKKVGKVTVTATAAGDDEGTESEPVSYTLTITKGQVAVPTAETNLTYTSKEQEGVKTPADAQYTLTENKKTAAGTYTATAKLKDTTNYEWKLTGSPTAAEKIADQKIEWKIAKKAVTVTLVSKKSLVGADLETLTYTSSPELFAGDSFTGAPATTADKDKIGKYPITKGTLSAGDNYELTFKEGTYEVYGGTFDIENSEIDLEDSSFTFNNKVQVPSFEVYYGDELLEKDVDYTVKYSNSNSKNVGKYTIKITGIGNYTGENKAYYKINPPKKAIKSIASGSKKLTVRWSKFSSTNKAQITGYQIKYSTSPYFTNSKTVKAGKNSTSKVIKGLKSKKSYYIKIRTYKTDSQDRNFYSGWSKLKGKRTK